MPKPNIADFVIIHGVPIALGIQVQVEVPSPHIRYKGISKADQKWPAFDSLRPTSHLATSTKQASNAVSIESGWQRELRSSATNRCPPRYRLGMHASRPPDEHFGLGRRHSMLLSLNLEPANRPTYRKT